MLPRLLLALFLALPPLGEKPLTPSETGLRLALWGQAWTSDLEGLSIWKRPSTPPFSFVLHLPSPPKTSDGPIPSEKARLEPGGAPPKRGLYLLYRRLLLEGG